MKIIMNKNNIKWIICVILFICFTNVSTAQIAIVVNKNNPIDDISIAELKRIYLAKQTVFSQGKNIVLAEYADLKEEFYDILLDWSLIKYKRHWMKLIFSGESYGAPKEFDRTDDLKKFISKNVNAIAFIALSDADDNVKILTVDGNNPWSKDYPFK